MTTAGEIADLIGVEPEEVAFLDGASKKQRENLFAAIGNAGRARDEELRIAVDKALGFVPRPLRGRVVKMLGGGRGRGRG